MSDLIDRQAAINAICIHGTELERRGITVLSIANHKQATVDLLESLPTADVVERKTGKWEHGYCSECGYNWGKDAPISSVPNYCPNCGADMREESNNG